MITMDCLFPKLVGAFLDVYWLCAAAGQSGSSWPRTLLSPEGVIDASWAVFAVFWLVAALNAKRAAKRESAELRIVHIAFMVVAFGIMFGELGARGLLRVSVYPDTLLIEQLGALLTVAGVAFAIWARVHIGRNWSGQVMIKQDHQLIRSGPYAHIRHPIYTGILLAGLGTAIAIDEYRGFVGYALIVVGLTYKAKREEAILAGHFGAAFDEHRKHTGFFLPRFT